MTAASLAEGTAVGRYQIRSLLGAGGMGEVYLAWESALDRYVALKILRPDLTGDPARVRRFVAEARAASALNHPAIVTIHDIGEEPSSAGENVHYIAMERVEGVTLDEWLAQGPPLPSVLARLAAVAEGLGKAHARGIVHRDLKPENIMITADGHAKILDFGVAKLVDLEPRDPGAPVAAPRRTLTQASALVGTPGYMPPEQIEGLGLDHRSDIFSFGCVLYEALAGRPAFLGSTNAESLHNIVHREPEPLALKDARLTGILQRIVDRCVAKDREKRYDSARDLSLDLYEAAVVAEGTRALPRLTRAMRSRRVRALGLLLAIVIGAFWLSSNARAFVEDLVGTARRQQISQLERLIATERESTVAALGQREKEIAARGLEIDRLRADLELSERERATLETSYRELLASVNDHLERNTTERSTLAAKVAAAEGELDRFRQEVRRRSLAQEHLENIRRALSPMVDARVEPRGLVLVVPGMFQRAGSSRLDPALHGLMDRIVAQLREHPDFKVTIEGHTDRSGSTGNNIALSQARADAVREHLVFNGIDPERITTIGRGEAMPAYSNETPEGRVGNRRVELIISL